MDSNCLRTMIQLKVHYEKLLAEETRKLAEETKMSHMFEMMAYWDGDTDCHSEDGVCVVCDRLVYTSTKLEEADDLDDDYWHVTFSYRTCKTCEEKTCHVCCGETAVGVDMSTNNYDCGKCPRCIVQGAIFIDIFAHFYGHFSGRLCSF